MRNNNYLFNNVVILLDVDYTNVDEYGNYNEVVTETKLFCNQTRISRNEFFMAGNSGYTLSYNVVVNDFEYKGQQKARYLDKEYSIIKTYPVSSGLLELTLGERVGDAKNIL